MTSQKNDRETTANSLPALKIGSRVRCSDDGIEGRITWANGVSVKIQWDDGEQVTWRRDSLAGRPITILDPVAEQATDAKRTPADEKPNVANNSAAEESTPRTPIAETTATATEPSGTQSMPSVSDQAVATAITTPSTKQAQPSAARKQKKTSALEASVRVLAEAGQALNCQEMIAVMASKGYWTSPAGKTPAATLYSALLRELTTKGADSRFVKAERGKFALAKTL